MGDITINQKNVITQSGTAEPVLASNVTGGSGLVIARNEKLIINYISSTTVDIDADFLTLFTSANLGYIASSVNLTANITASGVNGLDTGSEANSTWYHIWVIYNGTTVASLLSVSSTAPTMPSGYTFKKYVGAVYNSSGGAFDEFYQRGNDVARPKGAVVTGSSTSTSTTSANILAWVPSTAYFVGGYVSTYSNASGNYSSLYVYSTSHSTDVLGGFHTGNIVAAGDRWCLGAFDLPILTSNTIYYRSQSTTTTHHSIIVTRYKYEGIV